MADQFEEVRLAFQALKQGDVHSALDNLEAFLKYKHVKTEQQEIDDAHARLRREYREDVAREAKDLADQWRSGEFDGNRDSFFEAIDAVEVSNSSDALLCLLFSNNDGAAFDECRVEQCDFSGSSPWEFFASFALRQDVMEYLEKREGIDLNATPPREGEIWCDECSEYKPGREDKCDECREDEEEPDADEDEAEAPG